jgi:tetratricopeptide (TPR) repeat protein
VIPRNEGLAFHSIQTEADKASSEDDQSPSRSRVIQNSSLHTARAEQRAQAVRAVAGCCGGGYRDLEIVISEACPFPHSTVDLVFSIACTMPATGKAQDGLRTLDELRKTDPVPGIQAQADLAEADAQEAQAAYQAQLDSANAAANAAHNLGAKLLFARSRISQCLAELNLGDPAKADPLCNEARALNASIGDKLGTARAVNAIANALYYKGAYAQALPLYGQALGIARSIGDKFDEAGALNNLALIKSRQGDYKGAAAAYRESIAVARDRGDSNDLALAQQNLAGILYQQGDRRGAADMFDAAIKTSHGIGAKDVEARALNNRCMMEVDSGELEPALQDCQASLRLLGLLA